MLLQENVLDQQTWATRDELHIGVVTWIECTYRRRRQARLGRLAPIDHEIIPTPQTATAAQTPTDTSPRGSPSCSGTGSTLQP